MAAGSTYTPIATNTLGSNTATVTFNSFSGYTDLMLIVTGKISTGFALLRFNSDSGNNYSRTYLGGDGSSAYSSRNSNVSSNYISLDSTTVATAINQIMNYSNATTYKTVLARESTTGQTQAQISLWRNTAAITQIDITAGSSGTLTAGSTFTLYGIAAA
jgi:hypothetical protein